MKHAHLRLHLFEVVILVLAIIYAVRYDVEYEVEMSAAPVLIDVNDVNDVVMDGRELEWRVDAQKSMNEQILRMAKEK